MVQRHQALGPHIQPVEGFGGACELLVFVFFTHKCLHDANRRYILAHALVQRVVFLENLLKQPRNTRNNLPERETQNQHRHNENQAQPSVDEQAHHNRQQQSERRTHGYSKNLLKGLLQVLNVGRHARHEAGGRVFVDVRKRKRLDISIHRRTQIGREARRCVSRESSGKDAEGKAQQRHHDHQSAVAIDRRHVARVDAEVDEPRRHPRNQHVHHHFECREQRSQQGGQLVFSYLSIEYFQHFLSNSEGSRTIFDVQKYKKYLTTAKALPIFFGISEKTSYLCRVNLN